MAKRVNKPLHNDRTKELIRATQLLNVLSRHANNELELSATQIQAAKIVIGKIIPDLKAIEHSGGTNNTCTIDLTGLSWLTPAIKERN